MPYPLAACHSRVIAPAGSATPVIPPTTGAVLIAGLFDLDPIGNPPILASAFDINDFAATPPFTALAPYPVDYANIASHTNPPYLVDTWYSQINENPLTASGSARPVLQLTSSAVVTGAGSYAYFGQLNGKAAYGATDPTVTGIYWDSGWQYKIASVLQDSSADDTAFPWQATWGTVTVTQGTPSGELVFNGSSSGLAGSGPLFA